MRRGESRFGLCFVSLTFLTQESKGGASGHAMAQAKRKVQVDTLNQVLPNGGSRPVKSP